MLFRWINVDGHNPFLDFLLPFVRNKYFWAPLYIFAFSFLLINYKKKALLFLLSLMICVSLADNISNRLLKKNIKRLRPCRTEILEDQVNLLITCGNGYSFPSNHASNHFAVAVFFIFTLGKRIKKIILPLLFWAALVSFAQVYVGVHFPLDITAGAILGTIIGSFMAWLYHRFSNQRNLNIIS